MLDHINIGRIGLAGGVKRSHDVVKRGEFHLLSFAFLADNNQLATSPQETFTSPPLALRRLMHPNPSLSNGTQPVLSLRPTLTFTFTNPLPAVVKFTDGHPSPFQLAPIRSR